MPKPKKLCMHNGSYKHSHHHDLFPQYTARVMEVLYLGQIVVHEAGQAKFLYECQNLESASDVLESRKQLSSDHDRPLSDQH